MGKLSVYLKAGDRMGLLWRFGVNVGNIWNYGQATIPTLSNFENFTIIFEGYLNIFKNIN
jgi:hypothetical protein